MMHPFPEITTQGRNVLHFVLLVQETDSFASTLCFMSTYNRTRKILAIKEQLRKGNIKQCKCKCICKCILLSLVAFYNTKLKTS